MAVTAARAAAAASRVHMRRSLPPCAVAGAPISTPDGGHGLFSRHLATRSSRSPHVRDLKTPVWSSAIGDSMGRINAMVDDAILELRQLRTAGGAVVGSPTAPDRYPEEERISDEWARGFDALLAVHRSPGKHMLRPQLVLLGASHSSAEFGPSAVPALAAVERFAAGVELQHLFMLVHDDIIDRATRRRGVMPVHVALRGNYQLRDAESGETQTRYVGFKEASALAALLGDVVHARSMGLVFAGAQGAGSPTAVDVLLHHSYKACAAQFDDVVGWRGMEHIFARSEDPTNLMRQVLLDKGARHTMCAPLMSGMRLSGAGPHVELAGRVWGEHAGIALQAMDDVADLIGNFVTTGKDTFQDFRDGRLSLLLFLLWQRAPASVWADMSAFMSRGGDTVLMPHERKFFFDIVDEFDLVTAALDFCKTEIDAAEEAAQALDPGRVLRFGLDKFTAGLRGHCRKLELQAESAGEDDDMAGSGAGMT
uniref:Uncharacterized protein n=1 Tax=Bicosoecida sp. CB-2014 TaxID=1486930 RepID=A0A7S1G8M8_9STRA|mmetsp:Transcript_21740/g.76332  ORF Transcript_21740/g.76332 Transcript_21740/m.76332 type:complete len:482 (+) Transcript_21740:140-1585(+)